MPSEPTRKSSKQVRAEAEQLAREFDPQGLQPWELAVKGFEEGITREEDRQLREEADGRWREGCELARERAQELLDKLGLELSGWDEVNFFGPLARPAQEHFRSPDIEFWANGHHYSSWSPTEQSLMSGVMEANVTVSRHESEDLGRVSENVLISHSRNVGEKNMRMVVDADAGDDGRSINGVTIEAYDPERVKFGQPRVEVEYTRTRSGMSVRLEICEGTRTEYIYLDQGSESNDMRAWERVRHIMNEEYNYNLPEDPFADIDFKSTAQESISLIGAEEPRIAEPVVIEEESLKDTRDEIADHIDAFIEKLRAFKDVDEEGLVGDLVEGAGFVDYEKAVVLDVLRRTMGQNVLPAKLTDEQLTDLNRLIELMQIRGDAIRELPDEADRNGADKTLLAKAYSSSDIMRDFESRFVGSE